MNSLLAILLTVTTYTGFALAEEPPRPGDPQFGGEGRLIILTVVPGESTAKLYFIGKKAADINLKKDHKLVSVTAFSNGKREELRFKTISGGNSYEVLNVPAATPYQLDVRSEIRGKVEDIKVNVNKKP